MSATCLLGSFSHLEIEDVEVFTSSQSHCDASAVIKKICSVAQPLVCPVSIFLLPHLTGSTGHQAKVLNGWIRLIRVDWAHIQADWCNIDRRLWFPLFTTKSEGGVAACFLQRGVKAARLWRETFPSATVKKPFQRVFCRWRLHFFNYQTLTDSDSCFW